MDYPKQLAAAGLADIATLQVYATGHLVIWARRETKLDLSRGLAALTDARVRHVAIANPKYAPYGRAAVAALRSARLYDALQPKLVMGESLAQAAQLVESGNADVGLLSRSLVLGPAPDRRRHLRRHSRGAAPAHRTGGHRGEDVARPARSRARSSRSCAAPKRGGSSSASASPSPRR